MKSSSSSSLCLGAQPRDNRDTLQYQEAGRQEKVILWRKNTTKNYNKQWSVTVLNQTVYCFIQKLRCTSWSTKHQERSDIVCYQFITLPYVHVSKNTRCHSRHLMAPAVRLGSCPELWLFFCLKEKRGRKGLILLNSPMQSFTMYSGIKAGENNTKIISLNKRLRWASTLGLSDVLRSGVIRNAAWTLTYCHYSS